MKQRKHYKTVKKLEELVEHDLQNGKEKTREIQKRAEEAGFCSQTVISRIRELKITKG